MSVQPKDSPESLRCDYTQSSHAVLREIYDRPQAMPETYHFATLNDCEVVNPRHPVRAVGCE